VKRTQAKHVDAPLAEVYKIADHLLDAGGFDDRLYGVAGNHPVLFL